MVETNLPVMLLKNMVLLPYNEIRLEITLEIDKKMLNICEKNHDGYILLVNTLDPLEVNPNIPDLPKKAILGSIKSKIELPNGIVRVVIQGIDRVEVLDYINNETSYLQAFVIPTKEYEIDEVEASALRRVLLNDLNTYIDISPYMTNNVMGRISGTYSLNKLSDIIASEINLNYEEKIKYIEIENPITRTKLLIQDLNKELETVKLEQDIEETLKNRLDESQKEYVLREKLKLIKEELGEVDIRSNDISKLKTKIDLLEAPNKVKSRLIEELYRYEIASDSSPDLSIIRSYIDWILSLPWNKSSIDNDNIEDVAKYLDESHYGLEKVKRRIISYIAVKKNTNNMNSPIICLLGPPGCGKTTLAKSIARSLNKKFVKISVGGVNDEAEIMGHRRTYIGAMPGKIIQGLKKAGTNNPVFLIDEIDKITKDYRGDPASALLDILDKEQNTMFSDNYIEEEFNLSQVFFILTANNISMIPETLRDRLEIIELSSYTLFDKINIANNHLLPKLLLDHNIANDKIEITDKALIKIINNYTKEAGARELERQLSSVCREIVMDMQFSKDKKKKYIIDENNLEDYLGKEKYIDFINDKNRKSGIVNGMACSSFGGFILKVTCIHFKGKGNIILTGSLGEVLSESATIAISYIKSNAKKFGINYDLLTNSDIHIHFEEGAMKKEGPSAGITIVTAIISAFKNTSINNNISMTGEMTLRGRVLPVGGIKEKLIAAFSNGIKKVFIPKDNANELDDVPRKVLEKLEIVLVKDYEDIYNEILKK